MAIHYRYDPSGNIIHTTIEGVIKIDEVLLYIEGVLTDKSIKRGFIEIVNFEEVKDLIISFTQMSPFREIWERYIEKGCKAILMFAPTNLSFGICRMTQAVIEPTSEINKMSFEVFRTKEALEQRMSEIRKSSQ